jgi:hypothetical protein
VNGHWGYTIIHTRGHTPPYTGDLSNDPKQLEQQLSRIFELAAHWKALLLLDEADAYAREFEADFKGAGQIDSLRSYM